MAKFPVPPLDASVDEVRSWLCDHLPEDVLPEELWLAVTSVLVPAADEPRSIKCVLFHLPAPLCAAATARVLVCVIVPTAADRGEFQVIWNPNRDLDQDSGQREAMLARCCQLIDDRQRGLIDGEELWSSLFDVLIHASVSGYAYCWFPCLEAMSHDVLRGLLSYAESHPEPRVFRPHSGDAERHAALAAQTALMNVLNRLVAT